jgi:hypothetical protein
MATNAVRDKVGPPKKRLWDRQKCRGEIIQQRRVGSNRGKEEGRRRKEERKKEVIC